MSRRADRWFVDLYAAEPDPWGFETRWYEVRKRSLTMAMLSRARYESVFEPGCAQGLLTVELAARSASLLALDPVPSVVDRARERVQQAVLSAEVQVRLGALPEDWPVDRTFDLVVLSEVGYYLDADALHEVVGHLESSVRPGGDVVAVHWAGPTDYPSSAATVHRAIDASAVLDRWSCHRDPEFLLDLWRRS